MELVFESYLHGTDGEKEITTSENGTVIDEVITKEPVPGENVFLFARHRASGGLRGFPGRQNQCYQLRAGGNGPGDGRRGRRAGRQYRQCAWPAAHIRRTTCRRCWPITAIWQPIKALRCSTGALQGLYSPGSTFKMVTALAGLRTGTISASTTYECTGAYTEYEDTGYSYHCWIYPGAPWGRNGPDGASGFLQRLLLLAGGHASPDARRGRPGLGGLRSRFRREDGHRAARFAGRCVQSRI